MHIVIASEAWQSHHVDYQIKQIACLGRQASYFAMKIKSFLASTIYDYWMLTQGFVITRTSLSMTRMH